MAFPIDLDFVDLKNDADTARAKLMVTAHEMPRNSLSPKTLPCANRHQTKRCLLLLVPLFVGFLLSITDAHAQPQRGTLIHEETIRVSPSADSAKLGQAGRGHELVIIDTSRDWTHVEAIIREPQKDADEDDEESQGKTITGWVRNNALVSMSTPNGDKII